MAELAELHALIEPVNVCSEMDTLEHLLPVLHDGKPAVVHSGDKWLAVYAQAVVGYPPTRRIIDLPLRAIPALSPEASIEQVSDHPDSPYVLIAGADTVLGVVLVSRAARHGMRATVEHHERLAMVGQLTAGVAHDFNNMLTGIIGFSELLLTRQTWPSDTREYLELIHEHGKRSAELVRQLLDLSRDSLSIDDPVDLSDLAQELTEFLRRTISETISIRCVREDRGYFVIGDPGKLQQLLVNLALNARDAMPRGGELVLRLSQLRIDDPAMSPRDDLTPGDWIVLHVSDTGVGIPPEARPRLFEPFFTTKARGEGTGLGLAQVYGIVRQHRGTIDVESEVGTGTTFSVYLPAASQPAAIAPATGLDDKHAIHRRGRGERLLLVEDERVTGQALATMLESVGFRVLLATSARAALELFDQHAREIAAVITDLTMPDMSGVELYHELSGRNPGVKVILISGYAAGKPSHDLLATGIRAWVAKPPRLADLAETVRQVIDEP